MNPPKFKIGQTVYTCWTDVDPRYRTMVITNRELNEENQWVYKGCRFATGMPMQYFEDELSDHEPTLEDTAKAQIHLHFAKDGSNDNWTDAYIERSALEYIIKKAGMWRDEYGS